MVLDQMLGLQQVFYSVNTIVQSADNPADHSFHLTPEFLRSVDASGLPPGELHLKVGCPLILLRNLAPRRGLCNGTRLILRRASERILEVEIIGGDHRGEIALIPRISLTPSNEQTGFTHTIRRRQFPVRLAFAMSINRAQGQSLKIVGIDLRTPVFSHGQLYVALSRATSGQNIRVLLLPLSGENSSNSMTTRNIVYREVLVD